MAVEPPAGLLEVGRCGKPHGVRGRMSVKLSTNREERLAPGSRLWIGDWLVVESSARVPGADRWIVGFSGFEDRSSAERLVNRIIWAEPLEDDDAIWVHQVIGALIRDTSGVEHGRCRSVIANPANDLIETESGALIPVTFVTGVIEEAGVGSVVIVDPPEGLFELYEGDVRTSEDDGR